MLSTPAVRNGGACGAAIRAARVLKHMPAPRSSSNTSVPRPPPPSGHAPWDTSVKHDTTVGNDPNPSRLTDGPDMHSGKAPGARRVVVRRSQNMNAIMILNDAPVAEIILRPQRSK